MKFRENTLYVVLFTFVITFLFVFVLTFVYMNVKDRIKRNKELFEIKAILNSTNISYKDDNEAYEIYNKNFKKKVINDNIYYTADINNTKVYVVLFTGKGLWSTINGAIGINSDFSEILGIDIIDQNETPGLGGRISEEWFRKQFIDEKLIDFKIKFNYASSSGDYDKNNNMVDGISGATITTNSLDKMINKYLSVFKNIVNNDEYLRQLK